MQCLGRAWPLAGVAYKRAGIWLAHWFGLTWANATAAGKCCSRKARKIPQWSLDIVTHQPVYVQNCVEFESELRRGKSISLVSQVELSEPTRG